MGYKIAGYTARMQDDLSSIPGNLLWMDSRFRYALRSNNTNIASLTDLSSNSIQFIPRFGSAETYFWSNGVVKSKIQNGAQDYIRPATPNFTRLFDKYHEMTSPFAIYCLTKLTVITGNTFNRFPLFATNGFSNTLKGIDFNVTSGGSIQFFVRNGSGTSAKSFTTPNSTATTGVWTYKSIIFDGVDYTNASSYTIRQNDSVISSSLGGVGSPIAGQCSSIMLPWANFTDHEQEFGVVLFYDWTGYDSTQRANLDLKVRALLAKAQAEFTILSP